LLPGAEVSQLMQNPNPAVSENNGEIHSNYYLFQAIILHFTYINILIIVGNIQLENKTDGEQKEKKSGCC
jgi:hypothetical protein